MKSVSIIVPCFNEYSRLTENLPKILRYCDTYIKDYELIFVNDGSTDKTLELLESYGPLIKVITYVQNRGKGYAVRRGLRSANKELVLFMDADLATELKCINEAILRAEQIPDKRFILIGNRELPDSHIIASPIRKFIGRTFNGLQYLILGINVSDTQCGFKVCTKNVIPLVVNDMQIDGWAFDVELLYLCKKRDVLIECIPVIWHDVAGSKVHPMKDSFKMFRELVRIKRIHG